VAPFTVPRGLSTSGAPICEAVRRPNTDRRTYHMELRATEKTYMASVSWIYPQDELIALRRQNASADAATPVDTGLDIAVCASVIPSMATTR
jgi:hypothetical protein